MNSKHDYYDGKGKEFINSYNFVTVNFEQSRKNNYEKGNLTGFLECSLKTITPLCIPDIETAKEDENGHKKYDFYRLPTSNGHNQLTIPGSTLRGAIRNVYETITDSCFSTNDPSEDITKRALMKQSGKPALLVYENNQWNLYKAERKIFVVEGIDYKRFDLKQKINKIRRENLERTYQYGDLVKFVPYSNLNEVLFDNDKQKKEIKNGYYQKTNKQMNKVQKIGQLIDLKGKAEKEEPNTGYLYIGEIVQNKNGKPQSNKHFESVFINTHQKYENVKNVAEKVKKLETIYDFYNDPSINRNLKKNYYKGVLNLIKNKKTIPVWYIEKEGKITLAAVGRYAFDKNMGKMLKEKTRCLNRNNLCEACSVFGMVSKDSKENNNLKGRVRFADASIYEKDSESINTINNVTLKELAGPKISFIPFYLDVDGENNINKLVSYDNSEVHLRGRKYYWHHKLVNGILPIEDYVSKEKNERNSSNELVKENNIFRFKVYFEDLTENELNDLKWALVLGDKKENTFSSNMCHKIGHGKPLGLGSAKIIINKEFLRDKNTLLLKEKEVNISGLSNDSDTIKDLKIISDITTADHLPEIRYPYVVGYENNKDSNDYAAHQWFGYIYNNGGKPKETLMTISEVNDGYCFVPVVFNEEKGPQKFNNNKNYHK